jgi:hypothetical protein
LVKKGLTVSFLLVKKGEEALFLFLFLILAGLLGEASKGLKGKKVSAVEKGLVLGLGLVLGVADLKGLQGLKISEGLQSEKGETFWGVAGLLGLTVEVFKGLTVEVLLGLVGLLVSL